MSYSLEYEEIDRLNRRRRTLKIVDYNTRGMVIDSVDFDQFSSKWADYLPDSVGEAIYYSICSRL